MAIGILLIDKRRREHPPRRWWRMAFPQQGAPDGLSLGLGKKSTMQSFRRDAYGPLASDAREQPVAEILAWY